MDPVIIIAIVVFIGLMVVGRGCAACGLGRCAGGACKLAGKARDKFRTAGEEIPPTDGPSGH